MSAHTHRNLALAVGGVLLTVAMRGAPAFLIAQVAGPSCNGLPATISVDGGVIVGGPDSGETYNGLLNGTTGNDVILGTSGADTIHGKQGDDQLCGAGGDDTITGDRGNDTILGDTGNDVIDGNEEDDMLHGGDGDDRIDGGYGIDMLHGEGGNDTMNGNQNNDELYGGDGIDDIQGGYGDDRIEGNTGSDSLRGNQGTDVVLGGDGNDTIDGGDGTDTLCGNGDDDGLAGSTDADQLDGGPGTDTLDGQSGNDTCRNGESNVSCEDASTGSIAACNDAASSSSVSSSSGTSSSTQSSSSESSSSTSSSSSSVSSSVSSSSSSSTSSSAASDSGGTPVNGHGSGSAGGGNGSPTRTSAYGVFRGSGLAQLAAATHNILTQYGLHTDTSAYQYTFHHEKTRPDAFASHEAAVDWTTRVHAACCSLYKYLERMKADRPYIKPGYIDWLTEEVARALGEDPTEIKAALLGDPHAHERTSEAIARLAGRGCEEAPVDGSAHHAHAEHMLAASSADTETFTVAQKSLSGSIAFSIMDGDSVFTDYGVSHTKEMHLLIVRNDLRHFHHLHPDRDADGVWRVPFTPPAGGTYWVYADFIGLDDRAHVLRFELAVGGDPRESGLLKDLRAEKALEKYAVRLEDLSYGHGRLFTIHVRDATYHDTPHFDQYLGAPGHGILISADGDFIHTHPSPAGDDLVFHTPPLTKDFYRLFTQFQVQERLFTVEFDVQR